MAKSVLRNSNSDVDPPPRSASNSPASPPTTLVQITATNAASPSDATSTITG